MCKKNEYEEFIKEFNNYINLTHLSVEQINEKYLKKETRYKYLTEFLNQKK